jgi:hypothetical protein
MTNRVHHGGDCDATHHSHLRVSALLSAGLDRRLVNLSITRIVLVSGDSRDDHLRAIRGDRDGTSVSAGAEGLGPPPPRFPDERRLNRIGPHLEVRLLPYQGESVLSRTGPTDGQLHKSHIFPKSVFSRSSLLGQRSTFAPLRSGVGLTRTPPVRYWAGHAPVRSPRIAHGRPYRGRLSCPAR